MAPSAKVLERELEQGVREVVGDDARRDHLTVNYVRSLVQEKLGLDDSFFLRPAWKDRSKNIIKGLAETLLSEDHDAPTQKSEASQEVKKESKNGVKRQSSEESSPAPKRHRKASAASTKKESKPAPTKKEEPESDLSELEDSPAPPSKGKPKKTAKKRQSESELSELPSSDFDTKKKPAKAAARRKTRKESDTEEDKTNKTETSTERKRKRSPTPVKKRGTPQTKDASDSEDELTAKKDESTEEDEKDAKPTHESSGPEAVVAPAEVKQADLDDEDGKPKVQVKAAANDDSSSELSSIADDPPPKKKPKSKEPKMPSKSRAAASKTAKETTGDEAEVKKLQGQLVKCGVRKIWGIELKQHGDNNRAKVRHLKGMLADVGMGGRFSEAKAKEIKERRELMADLEAVQEMNRNWGAEERGRTSRSKTKKPLKAETDSDSDIKEEREEEVGDDDEAAVKAKRVSKRMADLAFLGDDSESE